MPELARFFGIIVRMYAEVGAPHQRPHFHAYYQQDVQVFAIDRIEGLAGSLPRRQRRMVEAWAELHQEELLECWTCLQQGRLPRKIEPLR